MVHPVLGHITISQYLASVTWHTFYQMNVSLSLNSKSTLHCALHWLHTCFHPAAIGVLNLLAKYAAGSSIKHCLALLVPQQQRFMAQYNFFTILFHPLEYVILDIVFRNKILKITCGNKWAIVQVLSPILNISAFFTENSVYNQVFI